MINKSRKRYMGNQGALNESDALDEPFMDFKTIFLSKYYSSYWMQVKTSESGYEPALCCASFETVRKLCDMLRPYLLSPDDESPRHKGQKVNNPDTVWLYGKEYITTVYIDSTLAELTMERYKIYTTAYPREKRMMFMDKTASLYSIVSRYFNRMGIGLTELSTAEIKFGVDDAVRFV